MLQIVLEREVKETEKHNISIYCSEKASGSVPAWKELEEAALQILA